MGVSIETKQNNTLNFVKGLACLLIVWMHTNSGGIINSVVVCIARFGIPVFFMVSGYYSFRDSNKQYNQVIIKKISHIIKLIVIATLLHGIWNWVIYPLINNGHIEGNISKYISNIFAPNGFTRLFLLNINPMGGILWFLNALLYCYLIWIFLVIIKNKKVLYLICITILFLGIILRGYIQMNSIIPEETNINYFRNWLFMGVPFFTIGYAIHDMKDEIIKVCNTKRMLIIIVTGLMISFAERYIVPLEVSFGVVLVAIFVFIFAILNPNLINVPILNTVGAKYCFFIYIAHPIIRDLLKCILDSIKINTGKMIGFMNPIIVFMICFLLAKTINLLIDKMKMILK